MALFSTSVPTEPAPTLPRVLCLSTIYDRNYHQMRGEELYPCLSVPKRRDLYRCLQMATGGEVIVITPPPKARNRRKGRWLPAMETRFSVHRQLVCANWDIRWLRVPLSWAFYAAHALKNVRSHDLVLIDNYNFGQILAARLVQLFRNVKFLLDYEDGCHVVLRSWDWLFAMLAEWAGRSLPDAALLVHPDMKFRLPPGLPVELVPGFVATTGPDPEWKTGDPVRFVYTGTLDAPRGVDLLLKALALLPDHGWTLDIAGTGDLEAPVKGAATDKRWAGKVRFHGTLSSEQAFLLSRQCHVGLNCQSNSDPISAVTFPSKVFTYLSAGLVVLSSKASAMERVCGNALVYYAEDRAECLADAMCSLLRDLPRHRSSVDRTATARAYSMEGTATRLRNLLNTIHFNCNQA